MSKSITRLQYDTGNEGASYLYETQLSEKAHGGVNVFPDKVTYSE